MQQDYDVNTMPQLYLLGRLIDLNIELKEYDLAGPIFELSPDYYYIQTGIFFINLKTVHNMHDIKWNNTKNTDTGSDIGNFIINNPQYNILKLGYYNGYD